MDELMKANPRKDCAVCRRVIHCLHARAVHTIVDGYALNCRRCKVMYSLRCGQTAMPFGQTDMERRHIFFIRHLHRWSETTSFRFFSRLLLSIRLLTK